MLDRVRVAPISWVIQSNDLIDQSYALTAHGRGLTSENEQSPPPSM